MADVRTRRIGQVALVVGVLSALLALLVGWWVAVAVPPPASLFRFPAVLACALIAGFSTGAGFLAGAALSRNGTPITVRPCGQATRIDPTASTLAEVTPPTRADLQLDRLAEQRAVLVRGLAELVGQMPDELAWQATNMLRAAGVHQVVPDGELFDPRIHHVVGTEMATVDHPAETVARTVRPGYADADRVLVTPRVVVYATGLGDPEVEK